MMKEKLKLFATMILTIICSVLLGITIVNAESVASSLTIKSTDYKNPPMSFPQTFHVKKTTSGKWAYCITYAKKTPYSGVKYKKDDIVDDKGKYYILKEAEKNVKSNSDFFIYQTALWIYMSDKGIMSKSNSVSTFRSKVYNSNSATAKKIKNLVAAAKKAPKIDKSAPTIKLSVSNAEMTLSGSNYVSSKIKLTSSTSSYNLSLSGAPSGSTYKVSDGYVYVYVPASKVTSMSSTITLTAKNSKTIYNGQNYKPSNSSYQKMAVVFKDTKSASSSVTLKINRKVDVNVNKTDANGKGLSGAVLQVKNSSGTVVDKWTSNGSNHTVKNLGQGSYQLSEVSAPSGYILNTSVVSFSIDANGKLKNSSGSVISLVVMKNTQTDVEISKQSITGSSELPGATLILKNASGTQIDKWVSTTTTHHVKGLAAGTYTLTEIQAPNGYKLSTETIKFTLDKYGKLTDANGKAISKVVMKNAQSDVEISKQSITGSSELPGATLILKNASETQIDKWVSTTTTHHVKGLAAGTYTLTEIQAPNGYKLSTETIKFTLDKYGKLTDANGKAIDKVVMKNAQNEVKISKQDITTNKELPGAKLVVKNKEGKVVDSWTSTSGIHVIKGISVGTYTLSETDAPKGYVMTKDTIEFSVDAYGKVTDKNNKEIDKVVMFNTPEGEKGIKVKISKQDVATSKELPGAALTLTDSKNNVVDTWVSSNEVHYVNDIKAGTYTLTETQAPNGYVISKETIKFTVDANGKLTDESGKAIDKVVMYNKKIDSKSVIVSKQDIATSKELPGASLVVKDASGNVIDTWISTNEPHAINNIKAGTYTLTETQAPNGYVTSTEIIKFTVDENAKLTDETGKAIDKVVMFNKPIPKTDVTISKQDITTSKELPGASLVVKDASGNVIDSWVSTNNVHVIKGLTEGTYTLTETQAPNGYIISTETITFKIDANGKLLNNNGSAIDKVVMYNEKEIVPFKVPIVKQDAKTHKNVVGAVLNVTDATGKVIDTWTTTAEAHYLELTEGSYKLIETTAPAGYILNSTPVVFNVTAEGKVTDVSGKAINSVVMNNTPVETKVSISKQDITNGKEIPGAKLVVKDANGNVIDTWTSTTTPHLITGLVPGEYTLNEVIAPNGYILSDETIKFTVKADGSVTSVIMYNAPESKPVPVTPVKPDVPAGKEIIVENTASSRSIVPTLFGGLSLGLGTFTINKKRKKGNLV